MRTILFVVVLLSSSLLAVEGMWVPGQLNEIAAPLKKAGLKLSPQELHDLTGQPLGAVVSLGGCTASFVSPDGLVITNHHCAYGGLQLNSTPENNLIEKGFIAASKADEISSGPNARIFVLDSIRDVTSEVLAGLTDQMSGLEREHAMTANQKKLVASCEKDPGFRCQVYSFFSGVEFRLFKNLEIKDVRLVYAPPSSIGNYGGEVDNWMWPRHTGDFTVIRAYVGKDGKPAPYSKDNVPFKNKRWLRVAKTPLRDGDFVMIAGYPGQTNRYAMADSIANIEAWTYPYVGSNLKQMRDLVHTMGKANPDIAVKYANTVRGWENVLKNYDGKLEGFKRIHAVETKRSVENDMVAWLKKNNNSNALSAYEKVTSMLAEMRKTQLADYLGAAIAGSGLLGQMKTLYRLSIENEKPNLEREPGFQERDLARLEGAVKEYQNRYHPDMEKALLKHWLTRYNEVPKAERNAVLDAINPETIYSSTKLGTLDERLKWLKASKADFESSDDPIIKIVVALYPSMKVLEDKDKTRTGELARYRPEVMKATIAFQKSRGKGIYPDANSSLRITFGNVMGYSPKDAMHFTSFTTAEGLAAKATGEEPFNAPANLLAEIKARNYGTRSDKTLGTLPVNFLSDLDITGGNSGSPVMNARGELVGLAFDGNWESVSSDWLFDGKVSRTISVDIRYVLWLMEAIFKAPQVVAEITQASAGS